MTKQDKTRWLVPVAVTLNNALMEAVLRDSHSTKSEFIRDAVRRKLEEMGYNPQLFREKNNKLIRQGGDSKDA